MIFLELLQAHAEGTEEIKANVASHMRHTVKTAGSYYALYDKVEQSVNVVKYIENRVKRPSLATGKET